MSQVKFIDRAPEVHSEHFSLSESQVLQLLSVQDRPNYKSF